MEKPPQTKTIVFIHGLFMNPDCWGEWMPYFQAEGFTCYAPAYPFHIGEPANLRQNINHELGRLTLAQVIENYISLVETLESVTI